MPSLYQFFLLVQYVISVFISAFAFSTLSYLLYRQLKIREQLISTPIRINMITWIFTATCDLPYTSISIYSWFNGGINPTIVFWFGGVYFAASTAVSISLCFLLLDRCFILIGPSWLNEDLKNIIHYLSALFIVADFFVVLGIFILFEKLNVEKTTCQTFSCVTVNKSWSLNIIRMLYGSLNSLVATVFVCLLYRYNKKRNMEVKAQVVVINDTKRMTSSRSNIIAGINVMSQIAFNFLPNLASFLVLEVFDVTLTSFVGPLVASLFQLDLFCTTIVYLVIVGGRMGNGKTVTSSVKSTTIVQRG